MLDWFFLNLVALLSALPLLVLMVSRLVRGLGERGVFTKIFRDGVLFLAMCAGIVAVAREGQPWSKGRLMQHADAYEEALREASGVDPSDESLRITGDSWAHAIQMEQQLRGRNQVLGVLLIGLSIFGVVFVFKEERSLPRRTNTEIRRV